MAGLVERLTQKTWDVIVVGGGSAGAVVAARMSEDPSRSVLLLEAGPDWRSAALNSQLRDARGTFSWDMYETLGAFHWQGLEARPRHDREQIPLLRGAGLGGSSVINGCYAIRPTRRDHAGFAAEIDPSWELDQTLEHYRRLENDLDFGAAPYHGDAGAIPIRRLPASSWGPLDHAFRDATVASGLDYVEDHNAPDTVGVSPFAMNLVDGGRVTTNDAYLEPVRDRDNLTIVGEALVDRVTFEGHTATGVRVRIGGEWTDLRSGNTILSAGTAMTPAILQRSGVGPGDVLRERDIDVVSDVPAGLQLQDHAGIVLHLDLEPGLTQTIEGGRAHLMARFDSGEYGDGAADLAFAMSSAGPLNPDHGSILACLNRAESRGSVIISSPDPAVPPVIEQNLLTDESDQRRMRMLLSHLRDMLVGPRLGPLVNTVKDANGQRIDLESNAQDSERWIRSVIRDTAHMTGTARMGRPDAATTVVDPQFQVVGVRNLAVVDASIFPFVPAANTNVAVIMSAEKAAAQFRSL